MVKQNFKRSGLEAVGNQAAASRPFAWMQRLKQWHQRRWVAPQTVQSRSEQSLGNYNRLDPAVSVAASEVATDQQGKLDRSSFPDPPDPDPGKPPRSWRWTLICFASFGVISGMGSAALLWLVSLPPPPECRESVRPALDMELLYCTQQAIQSGGLPELIAGLELLKQWSPSDPLYAETEKLAEEWSKQVLAIARRQVSDSDLSGALNAVSHIPSTTPVYEEAQTFANYWKQQWQDGEAIDTKAQEALKQQNWTLVSEQIAAMADLSNPYWNTTRANALAQQLGVEKQARQVLARVRRVAAGGSPAQLGEAIEMVQEISPKTHTWQTVRQELRVWSQTLLSIGLQRWEAGDPSGAVAALKAGPKSTTIPELQDLVQFSQAYQLLNQSLPSQQPSASWFPSLAQVWNMLEAKAALQQVKADSPFYPQAQTTQQSLQAQLDDVIQLHYATLSAKFGQRSTLKLAIGQAQQVSVDRPQRVQSQTLIAYWQEEIERIEDQPYLDTAIALAQPGEIPDLQAAIAEASRIIQGRSLRNEAQGWIATWQDQIETLEDQPILDRARSLANDGQLGEAIETAATIRSGRALYEPAQAAIYTWQAQLIRETQLAADRPILERARSLAASGDLYSAIRVASQIGAGRVLYGEAQGLIADWEYQLRPPREETELTDPDAKEALEDGRAVDSADDLIRTLPPNSQFTPSRPSPLGTPFPSPFSSPSPAPSISPSIPRSSPSIAPAAPPSILSPEVLAPEPSPPAPIVPPSPVESAPVPAIENPSPTTPSNSSFDGYYDEQYDENSQE